MESSTSTNFAQVMKDTTARRKFNVLTEVKQSLARFKHQYSGEWKLVPNAAIVKQITTDWLQKRLMVNGQTFEIPWTRHEVLSYITCLPPPIQKEEPQNRRLASIPLFYQDMVRQYPRVVNTNTIRHVLPDTPGVFPNASKMLLEYKACEEYHKAMEDHHPDGPGWTSGIMHSVECVLDVYNSLLRTAGIVRAYEKLLEILKSPKFDNLDPSGVYGALLHIHVRGVANSERLRNSGKWRESRSQEELYRLHLRYRCGDVKAVHKSGIIGEYHRETAHHVSTMNCELERLRMVYRHDHTKFRPEMIWWYSWHWGVFANMNAVNKHRAVSGCEQPLVGEILRGQETMFSVSETIGSSILKGAVNSPDFERAQAEIKTTIKEAMTEASTSMKTDLENTLRSESQKIKAEAADLLGDLSSSLESLSDESLGRATSLVERLSNSMDSMTGLLNSIKTTVNGFFQQILGVFKHLPGMANVNLSFEGIFKAFMGYIIYQNTDSMVLRSLAVIYILNNLQLLKVGYTYLLAIVEYLFPKTGENTYAGQETSCSVFETLSGSFTSLVHVISAVIASIAKGSVLSAQEFWKLVEALAGPMRTFGAIGLGCLGLTRITTFVKNVYTVVVEWISTNIFGRTPEKEAIARKALILICKINYFDSEAGLNAIRVNQKLRKTAETIFAEWIAMTSDLRLKPDYKNVLMDLERVRSRVKNIADYITRLEAMSSFCPTMFHIQFVGQPGVGKSFLTKTFVDNISKTLWPEEKSSLYSYNPNLEFFDGYAGQRVFYMDDCFRMQEPKHLTTLIGLITNTPVILPMANLEDKGLQLTSDVMISSTNTAWPIGKDVLCMEAVHRRRHMLVEVKCDDRVRDPSSGAFSMNLYLKYYKAEDLPKFPHLTFNLLRPVPTDFSGAQCEHTSAEAFDELQKYALKLHDANVAIQTPGTRVTDPMFYFSDDNRPPEGIPLPCTGWKYEQLVHTFIARYRAFRGAEANYSTERKFLYAERAIAEIENLFTQKEDIVHPEAESAPVDETLGPVYDVINKWMTDIQHPYGVTDEIGERLVEQPDLCPELDHVDFEAMVDKILAEGSDSGLETSDYKALSLEEEKSRTKRLLSRVRARQDPIEKEMLRMVSIDGKQHIKLNPHYTFWDNVGLSEVLNPGREMIPHIWNLREWRDYVCGQLIEALPNNASIKTENLLADTLDEFETELERLIFAKDMYYPRKEIFGALQGTKSPFSLRWLQCLKKRGVDWYLDVSHMNLPHVFTNIRVKAIRNDKEYLVPLDWAFLFSITSSFRMFCLSFDELTTEQQDVLIEEANWRNQYTGFFTLESVRKSCSSTIFSGCIKTLELVLSPLYWLCDRMPLIFHTIAAVSIFCVIVWMMKKLAGLIIGRPSETSRYLHRGPQSHIKYHGRPTSSAEPSDTSLMWLDTVLDRNIRECTFSDSFAGATCQVLLSKQFMIFNAHVLRDLSERDIIVTMRTPGSEGEYQRFLVPRNHFEIHPDGDLAVCWIRSLPMARDITSRLYTEKEFDAAELTNAFYLLSRYNNKPSIEIHTYCRTAYKPTLILSNNRTSTIDRALILDGNTIVGKSGSAAMYLDHQSNMRLLGIQAWSIGRSYSPQIAIQVVTQEVLTTLSDRLIRRLGAKPVERLAEYDSVVGTDLPGVFTSREYNQVVEQVPKEEALGEIGKSKFQTTPIASYMERDGVIPDSTPAALSHRDPRLVHPDHPLKHSVSKYVRGSVDCFDNGLLSYIREGLGLWISSKLDKKSFRNLAFEEIVTGTREDGSNPMNLTSSPGVPYVYQKREGKGKKQFFQISEEGYLEYYDPQVLQEYTRFISCLRNRQLPLTRAYDFPKDELRPVSKALGTAITPPKTRSVTCMNMLYVLAWREVTLDFWASMHRAADGTFPFCPGINPEGPDWNAARRYLNRFEKVVDFDVSNWDGFLPADLLYLAGDIVADVSGLKDSDRNVVDSILHEVMNCYIQYGTHIYKKSRGMVSGFPGTAEMNSLVHWILLLYIYFYLTQNNPEFHSFEAFRANVSCLFYGDDVIISFSDEIADIFNGITISQTYYSIGYPVTAADKSGEIVKFKRLEECSFLKSKWHPLCPSIFIRKMDKSVVHNLLYWVRAKEQPVEQFYTNLIDSLRIMFGHGEKAFKEFVLELNGWLTDAGLEPILYTYRDLLDDHMRRYYSVNIFGY